MINNMAKHNFGNQPKNNQVDIDSKALETIKILGNQVLEMRDVINKQTRAVKALREEIASLKKQDKGIEAEINILRIDQQDVLSQMKSLKQGHDQARFQGPNQDEISRRFYPNYDESPLFKNAAADLLSAASTKKTSNEQKDFVFARIPKLLNLD